MGFISQVLPALHDCYRLLLSCLFRLLLDSVLDGGYSTWNSSLWTRLQDGIYSRRALRSFYQRTCQRFVRSLTLIGGSRHNGVTALLILRPAGHSSGSLFGRSDIIWDFNISVLKLKISNTNLAGFSSALLANQ